MITLNVIIDIVAIMPKYKQAELTYQEQVKSDFSEALQKENLEWLDGLIDGLVKSYEKMPRRNEQDMEKRKKISIENLKIFNIKNSQGKTAVMLAAEHGRADLLKEWYDVSGDLTNDKYLPKELKTVYALQVSSYIAQDNERNNALMLAIKSGNSKCFPFLLSPETAITLNQKDKDGKTALIHAINSENFELIKEFLETSGLALGQVNQYDPERKVKLKIDANELDCIQNIKNEDIKFSVKKFLDKLVKHIYYIGMPTLTPACILKRKSIEQDGAFAKKKRGKDDEAIDEAIRAVTEFDYKTKSLTGPFSKKLDRFKEYVNFIQLASDYESKAYPTLEELKEKCQEVGQFLLKKLLYEVNSYSYNLRSDQKEKILVCINNLVIEAKIEFPEDQIQNIPSNIIHEVLDILNAPNPQLHSRTNSLASGSSLQR
ncbi:ankyrin repeat domain-containing protein [Wolbachia endosymbiont of Folsomia candida]|uniref:ankyrin repeat domain-containing protein n=1 Tax=Wolbachia endosymbiont of Folsomia candida TaxID=169402 RepID=UPI000A844FE0|nr:ankyrin repeat domain-containing protein [Wolbachia endosymbiont of Folsomia candida]APR98517.1 hypothetical protein ASM33_04610 [Wolbachia endosymbiont of Folsomia candida]